MKPTLMHPNSFWSASSLRLEIASIEIAGEYLAGRHLLADPSRTRRSPWASSADQSANSCQQFGVGRDTLRNRTDDRALAVRIDPAIGGQGRRDVLMAEVLAPCADLFGRSAHRLQKVAERVAERMRREIGQTSTGERLLVDGAHRGGVRPMDRFDARDAK